MKHIFRSKKAIGITSLVLATSVVLGTIAINRSKNGRVSIGVPEVNADGAYLSYDSASLVNYSSVLGRAVDFGIVTNRLEQRNHMETTYATNDFYNQKNDNCDVDLAGTAPAQFIIASISGGKARFGYTYGAKNDYQTAPSMQFVIDTTPDLASSDLFTYDAGSFKGEALYRTFTEPDLKSNVNGMIQHFKDESDKMLQHVAFDGDAVFNASTGAIDFSDECYKNTTLYINVQPGSRLESAIQATEGLNIIKDPSTVVVFNILNTDYIKLAKYKVTSDNMTMDTYTDHSGDDSEKNKNIDKYITRKIIWNVPYAKSVDYDTTAGLFLVPNPDTTGTVTTSSAGWIAAAGTTVVKGGEFHYIFHDRSEDANTPDTSVMHFALRKAFVEDGTPADQIKSKEIRNILVGAGEYTFTIEETDENYNKLTDSNAYTDEKSTDAYGKVVFKSLSETVREVDPYNGKHRYFVIKEKTMAPGVDSHISQSNGEIHIDVLVTNVNGIIHYQVSSWKYADGNNLTDSGIIATNDKVDMSGTEFSLGGFYNYYDLKYAKLSVTKNVNVTGTDDFPADQKFNFALKIDGKYVQNEQGELGLTPRYFEITRDQKIDFTHLIPGTYTIEENPDDIQGFTFLSKEVQVGSSVMANDQVVLGDDDDVDATLVNNYQKVDIDGKFSLKVKKNVDVHFPAGMARDMSDFEGKEFHFTVKLGDQYVQDKNGTLGSQEKVFTINYDTSVQGPGAVGNEFTIYGLDPNATYTVTEVRDQNYTGDNAYVAMPGYTYTSNANDTTKNVTLDQDGKKADIVNKYEVQKGKLTVNKSFTLIDDNNANGSGSVDTASLSNLNNLTFTIKGPLGFSKTLSYEDITAGRNVFENVPAGKYTIIEENASETSGGNYTFVRYSYVGADGTTSVAAGGNQTITVYNQYRENYSTTEKGNITIAKSMDGAVAPAGSVFNFTIKNSLGEYCEFDAEGNFVGFTTTKTYASLTFPAGSGYYSSREFKNIPTGSYTVEEEPTDEQKTLEGKNLKVEYMVDGVSTQSFKLENYGNKQVQVNNHYREYMLEVEKLVSGDIPYDYTQYDMEYSFVIKKGDQYVQPNGNLTGTAYTFKIKPNQKMQIPVTDAGDYQVIETTTEPENSLFTLTTTYSTVNGEVTLNSANKDDSVIIHNNYTYKNKGSLEVKKEVSDPTNSAPAGTEFTVGVKINRTASFDVDFPDGTTSSVAFEKDVVKEFTLKAGESIKINGLYAGTEYEVTESNIPSDYSLASNGIVYGNTEKKITKDTEDLVTVNNKYDNIQEYFTLSVEKNWDDANNQDGKRPTEVVVILKQDGNEIDRTTLNDSNNWTYTATNLPKYNGTSEYVYTWEEVPVANYTTTYSPAAPIPNGTTTVTNSYTPETTSATVTKKWVDFDNAAGKRPTEIVMTLTNGDTVKLNAGNNWTATISGLPKYSNGVLINYTWTEENMPQGYSQTDCTTLGTTTTIENTYDISLEKTTMKVTKVWDDNNDQDGMRPQNLTVTLRKNNVDFMDVVLNDSNNWTAELNTLAKFDDQGALITYEWVEPAVTGYTSVSSGTVADRVFTNTHAPEKISLSVEKIWDDNNNQDGKRPADITVILKKDSADFMTFTLNDGNGWKETASDLDKYENGREIAYEWAEVTVPEYTTTTSEAKGVTTITNKHVPETVSVAVAKTWVDDNNRDGKRPASLNVTLKKDGTDFEVIELNDGNSWSYSRSDLPKYENGALIDYSWEEESVADYTSEKTGVAASTTFTNTHETEKVSLTVTKTWVNTGNSAAQPSSVVVDLLADGTPVGSVTLNDGNNWTDSISDLPVYENGVKINYEWKEQVPANYQDTYTGNGTASTTIKNTYDHSVERTTAKVTKTWDDSNNQDGKRPTEVEVQLMQNGVAFGSSVRLDEASGWTYEATDLPKYDANGDEYTYTWEETPVTDYTLTENSTVGTETTLKNSYTTETVDLKITKTWSDNNDITGNRPISVDVNLLVNGTAGRTVTLKASENWTAEVTGLAKYSNGTEITYTWEEVVPANYNPTYSGNGTADVEITNAYDFSVERTTAKVTKTWDDSNNQDGKRPTEVEVQLMQNGVAFGSSVRLDEASGWTYEATDLPKYDVNGDEYTYTWEETPVTDYTLTENNTAGTETTLKNSYTTETVDLKITKTWSDNNDITGNRPISVDVNLLVNGTAGRTVTLKASENWTAEVTGLAKYSNGTEITYTWEEVVPANYNPTYSGNGTADVEITNAYDFSVERTTAKVTKTWDDSNNQDGKRPTEVEVQLLQNGVAFGSSVTLDEASGWTYEATDLPKYDVNGDEYTYTWEETPVTDYTLTENNTAGTETTLKNTHTAETTDMTVTKTWVNTGNSSAQPTSVVVDLLADGTPVGSVTLNDGNNWTDSISDLPVYENGVKINYEWKEQVPANYQDTYTGNGTASTTIKNTYDHSVERTTAKVTKTWDDSNNQDGKRPTEVEVQLMQNGVAFGSSVRLDEASGWTYEATDLPKYDVNGDEYTYTWEETPVTDYTLTENNTVGTETTLKNTHAAETTDMTVTKTWVNTGNSSAQPTSVVVDLLADGAVIDSVTLDASNNWTYTYSNLDAYAGGQKIAYTFKEHAPANYNDTYETVGTVTTITNTYDFSVERTEATVTKNWIDNNDQDGMRPLDLEVQLLQDGVAFRSPVTLQASSNWTHTERDLPKYDAAGNEYKYTWTEVAEPSGYSMTGNTTTGTDTTITNAHTTETISLKVTKAWADNNDQTGNRPSEIQVKLLVNGTAGKTITLKASENWTATETGLAKYSNGLEINYSWEEVVPANYNVIYSGNGTADATITNTYDYTNETTTATVTKSWSDNNDQDGKRPTSVTVQLLRDGTACGNPVNLTAADSWTYTESNLEKYDTAGNEYKYTWEEVSVPAGYTMSGNVTSGTDTTITNAHTTETTSLVVKKTWVNTGNSSAQPASVDVDLYKGTTKIGTVTLDASNNWEESIGGLPVYENGTKITYEWKEIVPADYKVSYSGNGTASTTITNTFDHAVVKTEAKVTKVWSDNNDQDGKRPTEVKVQLKQNNVDYGAEVTLNAGNNWTYTKSQLPKFDDNGNEYTYTWDEVSVPSGYIKTVSGTGADTVITNTHTAETTTMTVKKTWVNTGNSAAQPASVVVDLMNGTTKVGSVTLSAANNWEDKISDLPVYTAGLKNNYEWQEQVPANYSATYTGNGTASTVVTNTYNFTAVKTTAKVTKVWDDDNDRDGKRPATLQVQLLQNGSALGSPVTLDAASGWTYEVTDLQKFDANGNAYSYTWEETSVPADYSQTGNSTSGTETTITNAHTVATTQLTVKKTWVNTGNSSAQPTSVVVDLMNGTTKVGSVTLDDSNNWEDSISNLPVNENGSAITYEWKEQVPTNYKESYSVSGTTTTITNTFDISSEKTEATVKKVWDDNNNQDGKRPTEVTVRLLRNGTPIGSDILLNDGNNWEYKAENLDKMDASGNAYAYTWEEDAVTGYSASKSESGTVTTFTNKHVPETKILTVEKIWDDANNVAGVRPTELVMTLSSGGSVTLNEQNGWTASVNVPVYANGSEIAYSWSEGTMPAGYTKESCVVNGNITTFTNKFDLSTVKTSVSVAKVWDDNSDAAGARPTELIVSLSDGTQVVDQATLNDANGWKYTANDLAMYDASGNVITYTWSEGAMPSGYALTDTTVNAGVTTFTNTYTAPVQVKGSLKIEKVLGPDAPASAATKAYHFTVTCPDGSTIPVEIVGASYVELNGLALGDYKITEDEADAKISGYDLSILNNDATVTLTDAAQKSVTVTNNYTQQQTTPAPTTPAPTTPAPTGTKTTQDASSETSETAPSEQPSETTATPTPTKEIESITIDDKPIKPEDFEKKPDGSIELKPETIDELTLGVHRMRITYTDGSAITVEFEVVSSATRPGGKTVVKTGDTGSDRTPVVAFLFIIVAAAALVILKRRTKKEKENEI